MFLRRSGSLVAAFTVLAAALAAEEMAITSPFPGVRYIHTLETGSRPMAIHLVEIDLSLPGLRFQTTEPNGDGPRETWTETTRAFVARTGAQIGINASFFAHDEKPHTDILSLAVSNGERYSPWRRGLEYGINFGKDGSVTILDRAKPDPTGYGAVPDVELYNAVAGNLRLLCDGKDLTHEEGDRHPRTAVGLTKDKRLLLLVVDGRHPNYSVGMTCHELAQVLLDHGATDAVNLDGGGSATLVFADPEPRVVNIPIPMEMPEGAPKPQRGIERKVGNNIAIFVTPEKP